MGSAFVALAAVAAAVLSGGSAAAGTAAVPLVNPSANVTLPVDYWTACWPDAATASCSQALLADIDYARGLEGVRPMVLPSDFAQLDPGRQTFVVTNLERVDRGLRPVSGITSSLSVAAQTAATTLADPSFTATSVGPLSARWWTGIWANTPNVLLADLLWMYQDGWAGADTTNRDCTAPDAAGCWGHRDNILSTYGGAPVLVAGVGSSRNWGVSVAEVVVGGYGSLPPLTYAWNSGATAAPRTTKAPAKHPAKKKHRSRKHRRSAAPTTGPVGSSGFGASML